MSRQVSLDMRKQLDADHATDVEIALITITHPEMAEPYRISSDGTVLLSLKPYTRGTISRGLTFEKLTVSVLLPDESENEPARAALVFVNFGSAFAQALRLSYEAATVDIEGVMASTPDVVEVAVRNLQLSGATVDFDRVTLDLSREHIVAEPWPCGRQIRSYMPGLHG